MELPVTRTNAPESLFERCAWFYALCREYLFRDHTEEITHALVPDGTTADGKRVVELGCGPGFYCCKLAQQNQALQATGIDLSQKLLKRARRRAAIRRLKNCDFLCGDAHQLALEDASVDGVIVSRLFLIITREREQVVAEIHRVLREGGRCFIAEPTSGFRTRIPLAVMWLLSNLASSPAGKYREPRQAEVMQPSTFRALVESQPWSRVEFYNDGWYQYAVCERGATAATALDLTALDSTVLDSTALEAAS
jgi:ubiquinone/menaquinone biosynthesis C-methylase UbiE